MVIVDATMLLLMLNEQTSPPRDPTTKQPIADAAERVAHLLKKLGEKNEQVLIASPVLAELLVKAVAASSSYINEFEKSARFKMVSFDQRAAIEHALFTRKAIADGDKKTGIPESWHKIKFDRQIIAIAKAHGVTTIYTDDEGLSKHAKQQGISSVCTAELTMNGQLELVGLDEPAESEAASPLESIVSVSVVPTMNAADDCAAIEGKANNKGEPIV